MKADEYIAKLRRDWRDISAGSDPAKADRLKAIEAEAAAIKSLNATIGVEEVITSTEQAYRQRRSTR